MLKEVAGPEFLVIVALILAVSSFLFCVLAIFFWARRECRLSDMSFGTAVALMVIILLISIRAGKTSLWFDKTTVVIIAGVAILVYLEYRVRMWWSQRHPQP